MAGHGHFLSAFLHSDRGGLYSGWSGGVRFLRSSAGAVTRVATRPSAKPRTLTRAPLTTGHSSYRPVTYKSDAHPPAAGALAMGRDESTRELKAQVRR